jgi:hypothetical protein
MPMAVIAAAAFLLLAAAQTIPPQQATLLVGSAMITEVKGEVTFTSPQGAPITAQRGSTLNAEDRIETVKGSVLLELQDGSQVLVRAHSSIVLKAPDEGKGYWLEQFIGKILVKIQKRTGAAPSFRMGTPSAVITVRGTRFEVEVTKKHKTLVDVFEGVVDIAGIADGSPHILIRPGFSTGVEQDRSPEQPREMDSGEGNGREGGREGQGPGAGRSSEDQQRSQPRQTSPTQGSEGKPD